MIAKHRTAELLRSNDTYRKRTTYLTTGGQGILDTDRWGDKLVAMVRISAPLSLMHITHFTYLCQLLHNLKALCNYLLVNSAEERTYQ